MKREITKKHLIFSLCLLFFQFHSIRSFTDEIPRLIVFLVVDQMKYEYLERFRENLRYGGFKKLQDEGLFCKNAYLNYAYTSTASGHATIFTGSVPSVHGIVSNYWYDFLKKQKVFCVEDKSAYPIGGGTTADSYSPKNLLTNTIGDQLRLHTNFKSKVISISLKERAAILSGGKTANIVCWFDTKTGNFITSSYYLKELPSWLLEFNKKKLPSYYLNKLWSLSENISNYKNVLPDTNKYEKGLINSQNVFPYDLGYITSKNNKNQDYSILLYTPYGNTILFELAKYAILNENLGKNETPDMLIISLSATDYIGHLFGPRSVELLDTYIKLDQELNSFLTFLETNIGKKNFLFILTSDHGVMDSPIYLNDNNFNGGIFKQDYALVLLKTYLNAIYGENDWILYYTNLQIYLNKTLIEDLKLDYKEFVDKAAFFLNQISGVAYAIPSYSLHLNSFSQDFLKLLQNSYHPKRSGDILLILEYGFKEDNSYLFDHNSPYTCNTHIPLIFYGWKLNKTIIYKKVYITDIVPTIANILSIDVPDGCFGNPIFFDE